MPMPRYDAKVSPVTGGSVALLTWDVPGCQAVGLATLGSAASGGQA
jgi:hypothetical protein